MVVIPIPSLDKNGDLLPARKVRRWTKETMLELTQCFGGATPVPAPGANVVGGRLLWEQRQMIVLAACESRSAFRAARPRLERFVVRMGEDLHQDSVIVLGFPADSVLIELRS